MSYVQVLHHNPKWTHNTAQGLFWKKILNIFFAWLGGCYFSFWCWTGGGGASVKRQLIGFLFLPQGTSDPKRATWNVIIHIWMSTYITTSISTLGVNINQIIIYMTTTSPFGVGIHLLQPKLQHSNLRKYHQRWRKHRTTGCLHCWHFWHCWHC